MDTTRAQKPKNPILTALLIALPLSLLGGGATFLMTRSLGEALVATAIGMVVGLGIFGLNTAAQRGSH